VREEELDNCEQGNCWGYEHLIGRLRTIFAIWFFAGMPLSMLLNGLYFVAGVPLPALLFFLSSLIYLSGSLLGGLWSGEHLRRKRISGWELVGTLLVFSASVGFLCLSIVFAVIAFGRL
jgi:hypothetical protein